MAKSKAAPRKTKTKTETPPAVRVQLGRALYRPRVLMFLALAVSSTVLLPLGVNLLPDLAERPEYAVDTREITISEPPHWVPHDLVEQVVGRMDLPKTVSLLDPEVTAEIAQAFSMHPWVEDVVSVRKSIPARLVVEIKYRVPVAMVRVKQGMYPIDVRGTLLPPADFSVADTKRYPAIANVRSTPQGPAGTNWGDVALVGAARIAAVLTPHWKEFGFAEIRLPNRDRAEIAVDEINYELVTNGGSRILWGRAPGTDHPGELTTEQKIGRLQQYAADYDGFDHPHGPHEIDIRHWREISRRPLTAQHPAGAKSRRR